HVAGISDSTELHHNKTTEIEQKCARVGHPNDSAEIANMPAQLCHPPLKPGLISPIQQRARHEHTLYVPKPEVLPTVWIGPTREHVFEEELNVIPGKPLDDTLARLLRNAEPVPRVGRKARIAKSSILQDESLETFGKFRELSRYTMDDRSPNFVFELRYGPS